jgi:hypothetical protein
LAESLGREKSSVHSAEAALKQQQQFAEKERLALEAAAREARTIAEENGKKVNDLTLECEKLQQEVAAAKAIPPLPPSPPRDAVEDSDVVTTLRADIISLQDENEKLVHKSKAIVERYKNSDLVCSRSPFVQSVTKWT